MCATKTGAALRTSLSTVADRDAPHGPHPPRNKQPPPTGPAAPSRRRQQSLAARATELNDLHALSHARRQADAPNSGFPVQYREREHERLELHQQRDGSCQDHIAGSLTPQRLCSGRLHGATPEARPAALDAQSSRSAAPFVEYGRDIGERVGVRDRSQQHSCLSSVRARERGRSCEGDVGAGRLEIFGLQAQAGVPADDRTIEAFAIRTRLDQA
jgi:hypothetical protein